MNTLIPQRVNDDVTGMTTKPLANVLHARLDAGEQAGDNMRHLTALVALQERQKLSHLKDAERCRCATFAAKRRRILYAADSAFVFIPSSSAFRSNSINCAAFCTGGVPASAEKKEVGSILLET